MKKSFLLGILLTFNLITPIATTEVKAEAEELDAPATEEIKTDSKTNSEFPVVSTLGWKRGDFGFPWSEVVMVEDEFEGNYVAVLDRVKLRNSALSNKTGVITEWNQNNIQAHFYGKTQVMFGKDFFSVVPSETLALKVGEKSFRLTGSNGTFPITEEIKIALKDISNNGGVVKIKLVPAKDAEGMVNSNYGFTETVLEIKQQTVDAWKVVYGNSEVAAE